MQRPNHIRPVKAFPGARIVALKFVIELPGLAVLQIHYAVNPPAIFQPGQHPFILGNS